MYMQINTSSEKIHKLIIPLKFEVLDVARKTINADTTTIFYTKERIVLFIYVTTIYLGFLHLCFNERRWRVCLGRCVRSNMPLIGGSIPQWPMFCFSFSYFFL
jgi:hypothetical protein